ncbi:MAG: asparagine synthase (glutamine-hydrolyzing) [Chitinophagales bacterium]|nr:asparagine synthase (glutamine-hydrolyzing) [Bacteroidota bacterium]
MCGITGIFSFSSETPKDWVVEMTNKLSHRGPDAEGFAVSQNRQCVLGHRRLSIIDLSSGANQPMQSSCGNYAMVFNGEIYNYKEIKADIEANVKINWKTNSDTEVLLEAFALWGKQFVYKLNGMFAIAIFDTAKNILWLFRDRMGIKPIYYYLDDSKFVFASELKAINGIKNKLENFTINKEAVTQYLRLGYIPTPNTIFNEVKKMPSASYIAVTTSGINIEKYWDIKKKITPNTIQNEKEAKEKLHNLIKSSVSYRLISDVPFGTFLSGGIDSSIITAIAQSISDKPINTFTLAIKDENFNESEYARKIADYLKTNHHELEVTHKDVIEGFDSIIDVYDEPFADSSTVPTMIVSKLARKHVKMTLSGDGGDEQFMGYGSYVWANRLKNPVLKNLRKPIAWALSKSNNKRKRVAEHFRYKDEERLISNIYSVEQYYFSERELEIILNKEEYSKELHIDQNSKLIRIFSESEKQAFFDLQYYLQDDLLVKVDRASMKYSLESRVPLLDHRIVEYTLNLDEKLKYKDKESKYLLKQLLYEYLPKEFFDRPKKGFGLPLKRWLKEDLSYLMDKYLSIEILNKYNIFDIQEVKIIEQRYKAGEDYLYNKLWQIIILNQWLEKNIG